MLPPRDCFALLLAAGLALAALPGRADAAGRLVVENAWIRSAPPAAPMRAGYATLRNAGDAPLQVSAVRSSAFGEVSLHATQIDDGVARMRELEEIALAPGASMTLAPGGTHLMLMQPRGELAEGAKATVTFEMRDGSSTDAEFTVRDAATDGGHDHHGH
jgi:periplasmic copper chaperone A